MTKRASRKTESVETMAEAAASPEAIRQPERLDPLDQEGAPWETPPEEGALAVGADESASSKTAWDGEPPLRDEDVPDERAGVTRRFSLVAPIKLGFHGVFFYSGRIADKIVSLYSKVFKLDPEHVAEFNRTTGRAYVRHGAWDRAIPLLEKALATVPGDGETRMQLAEAYAGEGEYGKACQQLDRILEKNAGSARALRALGLIHARHQDYTRAIECLEKAVQLDPRHAEAYFRLGVAYDNQKQYDRAVESHKAAIALNPRFAKAYQALGFTYESMGDRAAAVGCFKKALELE